MKKYNIKQSVIKPITPESAESLSGLFYKRVKATPDKIAYHYYDHFSEAWKNLSWSEAYREVEKWQTVLRSFDIKAQDKIAILLKNCPEWVFAEQASLSIGAVIVPLYTAKSHGSATTKTTYSSKVIYADYRYWLETFSVPAAQIQVVPRFIIMAAIK